MRAALKYVDLTALQNGVSSSTVEFQHDGAPAIVTAWTCTTSGGLSLPLIYASMQTSITMPLTRIRHINNGIVAFTVLLLTLSFWYLIHRTVSKPLSGVQASLFASVKHGGRQLYHAGGSKLIRFAEFDALIQAHNETMKQLRNVDAFVPESLRQRVTDSTASRRYDSPAQRSSRPLTNRRRRKLKATKLSLHLSTVVYVSTTPIASHTTAQSSPHSPSFSEEQEPLQIRGQRLIAAAEKTAHAANTANSGPFPTPAALTAFLTAVQELCRTHHGTLHRVCPDACVLHFHSAVRAHLPRGQGAASPAAAPTMRHGVPAAQPAPQPQALAPPEETWRHAAQDARRAAAFALDLVSWVDAQGGSGASARGGGASPMPDVHALLDTSLFTCGQYCPAGSEQTLQVALGRDVQRALGRVPQRIGVRVAVTEETATLLRAEVRRRSRGCGTVDHGVRLIPVDVLRTGRAGLDSEVVVLYEALPGRVVGDAAWQRYARCCCDGFAHMLRGDYAGALNAYRGVAEIEDLEPGLLPPSMRREAAASAATGGAVSEQVVRLVRECEHRVRWRITEPLCKARLCPLGIDAVLRDTKPPGSETGAQCQRAPLHAEGDAGVPQKVRPREEKCTGPSLTSRQRFPDVRERYVLAMPDGTSTFRSVVPSMPAWIRDQHGLQWHLARRRGDIKSTPVSMWQKRVLALGSAGALCSVSYLMYREVHPVVAKAIRDAPLGPMSDTLRSATPIFVPSSCQEAAARRLFEKHQQLRHPNLLLCLGFSESIEGGMMSIWEFSPGGTLRELIFRYPRVKAVTINRFGLHALTALSYLHERGIAHGGVCLDNVLVSADGKCRLTGHSGDRKAACELFYVHQTCYISPRMATGALPTPQCDMFCFGLSTVEALTKEPCWKWATCEDGQSFGTSAELAELMKAGGKPFSDALVQGRVVVNVDLLRGSDVVDNYSRHVVESIIRCLSLDPSERPTAMEVRETSKEMLLQAGLTLEEDELAVSTSDDDTCD
ncbi:protein_kinase [Leishmania braziliensis MHOM/BR/75/M2904]|nr:protein_kinase [Leishmania braziliensis MHOM/BR/75/M2904]